jgi:GxxExxY protein
MTENHKYWDITSRIIGCAMKVHNTLGNGFQEVIYQRCLDIEMRKDGLAFEREQEMPLFYQEQHVGTRRADFLVENCVLVELKAINKMEDIHLAQRLNYLEAYNLEIGLLLNFGATKLEFKRLIKQKKQFNNHKDFRKIFSSC